jgi:hypothetical protein
LQHSTPIFMFCLLLLLVVFQAALNNPKWLLLFGALAACLLLTRLEDGIIYVTMLYGAYLLQRWQTGIPWKWLGGSVVLLGVTHCTFAWLFGFPILYHLAYLPLLMNRQAEYGVGLSFFELTRRAFRIFIFWYFSGKFLAPLLGILMLIGTVVLLKKRLWYAIVLFWPHFFFLLFLYNGRFDVANLPIATASTPGFILLLLQGIQSLTTVSIVNRKKIKYVASVSGVIGLLLLLVMVFGFGKALYSLGIAIEDVIPASTIWRIVRANPPLPGAPGYQEMSLALSRTEQMPIPLREELIRAVRGNYRSWYLHAIGADAFERGLPEQAAARADFVYLDDYETKNRWEQDRFQITGTSPLWNEEFSGRIGAFPYRHEGTFIYRFAFSQPIDYIILADVHTQWGIGDVVTMWTSSDGEHWTLRHHNWNVHYTKDYYYQFFEHDFDGQQTLYVKYTLYAGDRTRTGNDNRGACLEKFILIGKY